MLTAKEKCKKLYQNTLSIIDNRDIMLRAIESEDIELLLIHEYDLIFYKKVRIITQIIEHKGSFCDLYPTLFVGSITINDIKNDILSQDNDYKLIDFCLKYVFNITLENDVKPTHQMLKKIFEPHSLSLIMNFFINNIFDFLEAVYIFYNPLLIYKYSNINPELHKVFSFLCVSYSFYKPQTNIMFLDEEFVKPLFDPPANKTYISDIAMMLYKNTIYLSMENYTDNLELLRENGCTEEHLKNFQYLRHVFITIIQKSLMTTIISPMMVRIQELQTVYFNGQLQSDVPDLLIRINNVLPQFETPILSTEEIIELYTLIRNDLGILPDNGQPYPDVIIIETFLYFFFIALNIVPRCEYDTKSQIDYSEQSPRTLLTLLRKKDYKLN